MVLALFLGCLKAGAPPLDGGGRNVLVVSVVDPVSELPATHAPAAFDARIGAELAKRDLVHAHLPEAADVEMMRQLDRRRDTRQRVELLRPGLDDTSLLLVETQPAYYSELSGQYRWTVTVHATLVPPSGTPLDASFDVPVFLHYHHEREDAAVNAASPVVSRRVGELLDTWLAGG